MTWCLDCIIIKNSALRTHHVLRHDGSQPTTLLQAPRARCSLFFLCFFFHSFARTPTPSLSLALSLCLFFYWLTLSSFFYLRSHCNNDQKLSLPLALFRSFALSSCPSSSKLLLLSLPLPLFSCANKLFLRLSLSLSLARVLSRFGLTD